MKSDIHSATTVSKVDLSMDTILTTHGTVLLIVPEVINFARCIALLPWLLAYLSKTVR